MTRTDVGNDNDVVLLNFRNKLKIIKPQNIRLKFNLDRLYDPTIADSFQAKIGGNFAALLVLHEVVENMTTSFNAVMIETANELIGKYRWKTQP